MFMNILRPYLTYCTIRRAMCSLPKIISVNYNDEKPTLLLSFRYGNADLDEREFNFNRTKEETIENTLTRIKTNITNAIFGKAARHKKKKPNSPNEKAAESLDIPLILKLDSEPVDLSTRNIDAWKEGAFFQVGDVNYSVCVNVPTVKRISLPKNIMAGFPVYPKMELEFCDPTQTRFEWFKICSKKDLTVKGIENHDSLQMTSTGMYCLKVGDGFVYHTSNDDIGRRLKICCEPRQGDRVGFVQETYSEDIETGPGPCPFEARQMYTQKETSLGRIRCVSYNILADLYVDSEYSRTVLFPYCPPYALKLDYRKQLFLKEILGYNGDIVCLQEVDTKVYKNDFSPLLEHSGLSGCFNEKGGQVVEGLACLFRTRKFRLIESHGQIVANLVAENPLFPDIKQVVFENEHLKNRFMPRTTALQAVILESLEMENNFVIVGNTHLYFRPDADHIRLLQAYVCVRYLQDLAENLKKKLGEGKHVSVMLFGDFNSCPENDVYQLMTSGSVSASSLDWRSNADEAIAGGLDIRHDLRMASACGTPSYTNYTAGFNGCLDYIFYDTQAFEVEEVIPLPSHEEVTEYTALPSVVIPSDHLALVCTLQWKQDQ